MTGASGVLGGPMCDRFKADGFDLATLGRRQTTRGAGMVGDLSKPRAVKIEGRFDILVHMAPLWLLPGNLESIVGAGVNRALAFSSTSIDTRKDSKKNLDRTLVQALTAAEDQCRQISHDNNVELTLFRPTMIYGFCRDKNITAIANTIKRLGFFPIAGAGSGLRQPVHALDLVESCMRCIDNEASVGRTYYLGGGEKLTYKSMVDRVFLGLGRKPRTVHVTATLYKALLSLALKLKVLNGVSVEIADRMNKDFCFDNGPAHSDFGYIGSRFLEDPARDLPLGGISH